MSDWSPFTLFTRSEGHEKITQQDVAWSVVLCLVAALGSAFFADLRASRRTREWKHSFCSAVLFVLVATQFQTVALKVKVRRDAGAATAKLLVLALAAGAVGLVWLASAELDH